VSSDPLRSVRRAFEDVAQQYAVDFYDELSRKPFDVERLRAFHARCVAGPVLDGGCGPAHLAAFLAALGAPTVGVDFAVAGLVQARRRAPRLPVVAGDLRALPIRTGACGGAAVFYALIYADAGVTLPALRELRRVLREGAPLLLAVHGGRGAQHFTDYHGTTIDVTIELRDASALTAQLAAAAFAVDAVEARPPYEFEHQTTRLYIAAHAK
jgi:SAM-dependent methyltransferase